MHVACGAAAHLILEEFSEWLNEFELQVLGQPSDIVVALDGVAVLLTTARGRTALNNIWI